MGLLHSSKSIFLHAISADFLYNFLTTIRKHAKITTSVRLWSPKPIDGVYKHTTHFVRKLRTYTTLRKLIWWYFDALSAIFSTIFAKLYLPKLLKTTHFPLKIPYKCLLKSTKPKKSPPPYVCHHQNRFTYRATTLFVSADTQEPKDVFQSKFWIWKSFEKFFRALQLTASLLLEGIF